jgi:hypothetical protein
MFDHGTKHWAPHHMITIWSYPRLVFTLAVLANVGHFVWHAFLFCAGLPSASRSRRRLSGCVSQWRGRRRLPGSIDPAAACFFYVSKYVISSTNNFGIRFEERIVALAWLGKLVLVRCMQLYDKYCIVCMSSRIPIAKRVLIRLSSCLCALQITSCTMHLPGELLRLVQAMRPARHFSTDFCTHWLLEIPVGASIIYFALAVCILMAGRDLVATFTQIQRHLFVYVLIDIRVHLNTHVYICTYIHIKT